VPALPSSVLEPLWVQMSALLPTRQDTHPLGCHRPRIADRVVFEAGGIPLAATLDAIGVAGPLPGRLTVHLDAGHDYPPCRQVLANRGMVGQIATPGDPGAGPPRGRPDPTGAGPSGEPLGPLSAVDLVAPPSARSTA
jgi:hypothetical protein